MLESEQQQQLTDNRSLGGCHQGTPVTAQQQQLTFLVTTQQPLPSVGHVIGQQQSVQNQSCYMSTGQVTSALSCVPSPVPSRTTPSTPHTHSSAISSSSPLSVQSTSGSQCSVQLRGTASCPPQSLNPSPLSSARVNAPSPLQTSSNAAVATVPHFQRQHSVSFTPSSGTHAEHLRSATSRSFDGEYDNIHQQQSIMCDASSQEMHHTLQLQQARQQHILQSSRMQQHQQQQQKCLKQPTTLNQQGQHQNLHLQQQQQLMQQQHCQQPQILQQQQLQVLQQQQQQQNFPQQPQIVQQKQQVQVQQSQQLQMQSQHGYVQFPLQKQLKKHFTQQRDDGDEEEEEDVQQRPLTAKEEYRELKHRFKFLVYENECYQEELRNLQRKLLKLSRDKNFLLDRLLLYEKLSDSSDESDSSVKTVEEKAPPKKKARPPASRRRSTNARSKGISSINCIDSDAAKTSLTEQQQQQMQKQPLQQPAEQQRLLVQATEATTSIGVPACSASEMSAREQRATVSVPVCCSSERSIKREEPVIGTPTTEDTVFEENRSGQFSSSAFTSPR
uniref:INO80 complex subunit E n=1 Tax=Elaeophora elaphi TaxID=1147741 RepID=A0A0R3RGS7_9BILA